MAVIVKVEKVHYGTVEELHLAHFSVKEYLLEQAQFNIHSASIVITKTCLTYLSDISGENSTLKDDFPMAQFSVNLWRRDAVRAEDSEETVESITNFLQDEKSFRRWIYLYGSRFPKQYMGTYGAQKLYYACFFNLVVTVRYLLAEGADVNAQCGRHGSALQAASARGHLEVIEMLIEAGVDINAKFNTYGIYGSVLQAASAGGHLEVMRLLLKNGADINMASGRGGNALWVACRDGKTEAIRLLLENGADINMASGREGNALCIASEYNKTEIVQLLLSQGANVNTQGGYHRSALKTARVRKHLQIVQILLDHGAVDDRKRKRKPPSSTNVRKKAKSRRI